MKKQKPIDVLLTPLSEKLRTYQGLNRLTMPELSKKTSISIPVLRGIMDLTLISVSVTTLVSVANGIGLNLDELMFKEKVPSE